MKDCFGQHGWKEFHRNRKNILDEFQRLLELTENRPIHVAHGQGVEAYIRKWLSEFLPQKYGVTSGYIIPSLYDESGPIYHFDIIIYNRLEAPILWTEGNEDNSEQGKYRAVPARHVIAVYEVKSRLTKRNVSDALAKLGQVTEFRDQLPQNYSSGVIFIELKESEIQSEAIIKALHKGKDIHGFIGGLVIRYENDDSATGRIVLAGSENQISNYDTALSPLAKSLDDLSIYQTEDGSLTIAEPGGGVIIVGTKDNNYGVSKMYGIMYECDGIVLHLSWSRSNFSRFCVDLLSRLEGLACSDAGRPSFGMIFDSLRQEKARAQSALPRHDYPFLSMRLYNGGPNGERHIIDFDGNNARITFWLEVANEGFSDATISDDRFKTTTLLPAGKKAIKQMYFQASPSENGVLPKAVITAEGLEIPYRLVYKAGVEKKDLLSLEKVVMIKTDSISLGDPHDT